MRKLLLAILFVCFFSCSEDKIVQLPKIEKASISNIRDVSPAYLFYDETKEDSVELNRKNLISTTNWLINIDKRLTLKQAIPKIIFLQEKKHKAKMHKNEAAKNYYTCNDTSAKNLGFIEFTDIMYHYGNAGNKNIYKNDSITNSITFKNLNHITVSSTTDSLSLQKTTIKDIAHVINSNNNKKYIALFKSSMSFQDYITAKVRVEKLKSEGVSISNHEIIYK